jgi:glycosyltransferase involved in cell wall biosynthesis
MGKIYTAVFRPWYPQYSWFGRDSGLVTEGLRKIGVDSRLVILQSEGMPIDDRFLPATREQFCDLQFWKSLNLDAVVFQGGGDPGIDPVLKAIHSSGSKLLLRLDSDGVVAPQVDTYLYLYNLWWYMAYHHRHPAILLAAAKTLIKWFFPARFGPGRISRRLAQGDFLLIESRIAAARLQRMLKNYGFEETAPKVLHLPIPVPDAWTYDGSIPKENRIISVARWYDAQKDAPKLVKVLGRVLKDHPLFQAIIIGDGDAYLKKLISKHAKDVSNRIQVMGRLPHQEIAGYLKKSKIFICSSRAESMNISSAEAACCGCSVVGPAEIASMHEYTGFNSGTMSWTRRTNDFIDAVSAEISCWEFNKRNPFKISENVRNNLGLEEIANKIVKLSVCNSSLKDITLYLFPTI